MIQVKSVSKRFGGVQALKEVTTCFKPGQVQALVGENGAGKSTLGKIIAGVFPPDSGQLYLDEKPLAFANTLEAQRAGICMIFQELDLFPHLSAAENMVIGNLNAPRSSWVNFKRLAGWCHPFLSQVELNIDPLEKVGNLPMGHQQLVAIARALSMDVRFLVMDEPTSSLTHEDAEVLFRIIDKLRERGVGIIYVSHKMDEIFRVSDSITVLRDGEIIGIRESNTADFKEILQKMVGRQVDTKAHHASTATKEPILQFDKVRSKGLQDVSFTLHRGEVLGLAGLVGSGRSEVGRVLFGIDPILSGSMVFRGSTFAPRNVRDAIRAGVALQPEDRKTEGLMMQMEVQENASISSLDRYSRTGWIDRRREQEAVDPIHDQIKLKADSPTVAVSTLSGGNQQKVLLARWLLQNPDIFFFDDPTRGVDIGAKQDIYTIIEKQAAAGKGVLLVSSELPELLRCCDRILVMNNGNCAGILPARLASQESIMELAAS